MAKVLVIQHHPVETLGRIADAFESAALAWQYIRTFAGHPVPTDMRNAGGLILMGGPMGVYEQDRYPFLCDELRLIEIALKEEKPVLGVCLGSQLLAAALGAKVRKGPSKEIGWYPVRLSAAARDDRLLSGLDERFTPLHWHGDVFDLPNGAIAMSSSAKTPLQAFRYGANAYGLLFHIEPTAEIVAGMIREFAGELAEAGIQASAIESVAEQNLAGLEKIAETMFSRWAAAIHRG